MMKSRQAGMSLVELVIVLALMAILLPVLAGVLYQFLRTPPQAQAAIGVQNQLRQAGRWLNLDGSRAQSFVLGPIPEPPPTVFWVVDGDTDKVFRYSEAGTFVGTFSLTDANRDSKGITTDGMSIWVLDEHDEKVYRYNTSGQLQDSFALTTPSDHLEGITTDGSSLWVVDKNSGVFRYSTSGTFQNDSFSLDAENSHAEGITTDGTSLWVVDKNVDKVFHYSLTGSLLGSFSVSPATHPEGITTNGTYIWVVDKDTDKIYKFNLTGAPLGSFGLQLSGNGKAGGLARTPSSLIPPTPTPTQDYGTFGWHDYTESPPVLYEVRYYWEDGNLLREEKVDGTVSSVIIVTSAVSSYEDIAIKACPTFVTFTLQLTAEWWGGVVSQSQDFFLQLRPEPWGEIASESLGYALFAGGGSIDQVFQYSEAGTFLGTLSLTDANRDSKGITTDGTSFWTLDKSDKKVYRYNTSGQLQDSFALTTPSNHLEGITTDGSSLWVVDKDSGVFRYSTSGTFQNDSFSLDAENSHPEGITTDGTSIWVVDKDVDKVFHYSLTGSLLGSFSIAPATHPEGITTDGTSIWVVDKDTDKIYKFDLTGAPLGSFGLQLSGNDKAGGLARTPSTGTLWVVDEGEAHDTEAIHWSGSDSLVVGNVHSNGNVSVSGSDNTVTDAVTAAGSITVTGHGHSFGSSQEGVTSRPLPINCAVEDFPTPTFSWPGDVNLVNEQDVWEDWPTRTRLKPGVYYTPGRISLGQNEAAGTVTFIADQIDISGSRVDLWPFYAGITLFGTGSGDNVIKVSGQHGVWRGMLYAPQGEVDMSGDEVTVYGSIVAHNIKMTRQETRILHSAY